MKSGHSKAYRKKQSKTVTAVQLALETDGFTYRKWGADQRCKAGDWLVNSGDDCYTIAEDSFSRTYSRVSEGQYRKTATVIARVAQCAGKVQTREGETHYKKGDYIVDNDGNGSDVYAISADVFHRLYEPVEEDT